MEMFLKVFNEILAEAQNGNVTNSKYLPLLFNTREMRYAKYITINEIKNHYSNIFEPTITIVDRKKLDGIILEYINIATNFYEHDNNLDEDKNPIKYLLYNVLTYTLLDEFDDIKKLFDRNIKFIKNDILKDYEKTKNIGYIDLLCGNLMLSISKDNVNSASAWRFHLSLERIINNKLYYFDFPCIRMGINNDTAYVFDIEKVEERNKKEDYASDKEYIEELENYQKSIKNLIDTAIRTTEINNLEIISLTVLLSLLNEKKIKEIIVPTVFLNRENALEISVVQNLKQLNKIFTEAQLKKDSKILEETLAKITTLKHTQHSYKKNTKQKKIDLIKDFKYLEEMIADYKIFNLPMEKDTNMYLNIIDNGSTIKNKLLDELDNCVHIYEDMNRKLKDINEKN